MAVFGTFNDITLSEIVLVLGKYTGRFWLINPEASAEYVLDFHDGFLIALYRTDFPVILIDEVIYFISQLNRECLYHFRYERQSPDSLKEFFRIPIDYLLDYLSSD